MFVEWINRTILESGGMDSCGYVLENSFAHGNDVGFQDGETTESRFKWLQNIPFSDPKLNTVLLTGGSSGSEILSSTQLLNIDGTVENCNPPSLPEPRKDHVTFVTKGSPPMLATCGGSTTWKGFYISRKGPSCSNVQNLSLIISLYSTHLLLLFSGAEFKELSIGISKQSHKP